MVVLASFISPFCCDREEARRIHQEADIPFFEVYVNTPIEICEARDPKKLYISTRRHAPVRSRVSPASTVPTTTVEAGSGAECVGRWKILIEAAVSRTSRKLVDEQTPLPWLLMGIGKCQGGAGIPRSPKHNFLTRFSR